jgi:hypothetical protein
MRKIFNGKIDNNWIPMKLVNENGNIRDSPLVQFIDFSSSFIAANVNSSERDIHNSAIKSYNMSYLISFKQMLYQKPTKRKYFPRIIISSTLHLVSKGQKVCLIVGNSINLEYIWNLLRLTSMKYFFHLYDIFWSFTTPLYIKLSASLKESKGDVRFGF